MGGYWIPRLGFKAWQTEEFGVLRVEELAIWLRVDILGLRTPRDPKPQQPVADAHDALFGMLALGSITPMACGS